MAIELGKAIELFNEILEKNRDYNDLHGPIQDIVRYRAIGFIFISRATRYEPKAIAGYLVKYNQKFDPPIPEDLLSFNFNLGRDVGGYIDVVQSIEREFEEIIANANPKPQPPQRPQPKPEPASEEDFNKRAASNKKSGAKPLPSAQPYNDGDYFGGGSS